jgi:hypothetical protein
MSIRTRALRGALGIAVATMLLLAPTAAADGPGGPVLVITSASDPFTSYYSEILRAEGLNEFTTADISSVSAQTLASRDVAVLGSMPLSPAQVSMLSSWVAGGGNLIAMKPDPQLAGLLGLSSPSGSLANGYIKIDTGSAPGAGITGTTMQYHGSADLYGLAGASTVATLYSDANGATGNPAVTLHSVGASGGQAAAFTYDLAHSVIYTRQGNPAQAGQEVDQLPPIRSDDLFFPSWVDFSRIAIPQADEQQRLLANLITQMTLDRTPLPRFWYLPRGEKAAVVMTGDDHQSGFTPTRFEQFKAASPSGCSVADWQCVRATSYVYVGTPNLADAASYQTAGFEIALHYKVSGPDECNNFTSESTLSSDWSAQLTAFASAFGGLTAPRTSRTHCIVFSDWSTEPRVELSKGIRLDTNYYYWPASWVNDRPGLFTGSGFPMRFADTNGATIDVYQAATQMTDESGQSYPFTVNTLLDRALGADGYYGAFTANMHNDTATNTDADAIVASARARGVSVVSAVQMLDWLDGRNNSSFGGVSYSNGSLRFSIAPAAGSRGLTAMVPANATGGGLLSLTRDGAAVQATRTVVKGVEYAMFAAAAGSYVATYPATPASAVAASPQPAADRTAPKVTLSARTARASRRGIVTLRVRCPASESRCTIRVRLVLGRKTIARSKAVKLKGGKSAKVTLKLNRSARHRLAVRHRLKVKAVITATDAAGNRSKKTLRITLRSS